MCVPVCVRPLCVKWQGLSIHACVRVSVWNGCVCTCLCSSVHVCNCRGHNTRASE